MPITVWVATANIYVGSGGSYVLGYTPGNVVPNSVVTTLGLEASGLVQTATIADDGTSTNWHGTDPVTHSELEDALAGLAGGGGATDAQLRDRTTHTGLQTAATISDLREAVEDYVAALLGQGTNVTLTYTDNGAGAGSLSIAATGGGTTDPEAVRDAIGIALVGAGLVSVAVNDAGDTITVSTTATANSTDAQLRDRATHTGLQPMSTISDATTVGKAVLAASSAAAARTAIDAASSTHTHTLATAPAQIIAFQDQNGDGTWPDRPTSRTDIKVFWIKIVVGSADPASATSPAVNGAYARDGVLGV